MAKLHKYKWTILIIVVTTLILFLFIHNYRLTKDRDASRSIFFDATYFIDGKREAFIKSNRVLKSLVAKLSKDGKKARMSKVSNTLRLYLVDDYWLPSVSVSGRSQINIDIRHKTKYRGDKKVEQELRRVCLVINDAIAQNFAHQIQTIKVRYLVWKPPVNPEKGGGAAIPVKEKILRADELNEVCNYMDWLYSEENEAQPL